MKAFFSRALALIIISGVGTLLNAQAASAANKTFAQQLVEHTLASHPELDGVELASTPLHKTGCVTIAATETKEIGEKCDKDEFTAMKTNKPFVEKEVEKGKEVYDVTVPIHDSVGKIIGTAGIDFKPKPGQQQSEIEQGAKQIAQELEAKIKSKERLFEAVE